jgi:Cu(I)/Ag(I) efflux system membrane fusion protein
MKRLITISIASAALILAAVAASLTPISRAQNNSHSAADKPPSLAKQLYTCGMHPQVIEDHPGFCPICHMKLVPLKSGGDDGAATQPASSPAANGQRKILYWWDPMLGPSSISPKPGKSAMGMDLVPVYENQASAGPLVRIDPTVVQNMGVRTAEVTRGPLVLTVRTVGNLMVPEPGLHDITLKINGWIDKLYADTDGMMVKKDQPLFDLYSPDLQVAEEELISAVRSLKTLDPHADDPARREAQDLVESTTRKLRLWDVSEQDIKTIANADRAPRTVTFRSPADGHVLDKTVVQGSAVQMGMKLMRIEDHSKLWLDAQVYEDQLPWVSIGQKVEATIDGAPGKMFSGAVSFIYPHLDHMTRTDLVRTIIDNPNHELRPGMYATVRIITRPVSDAIQVPREAVIDTGTRQIAFVVEAEGRFQPRKVRMGLHGDEAVQILEGLVAGEQVVTSGQFLMDVESRTTEAIEKLRAGPAASAAAPAPATK